MRKEYDFSKSKKKPYAKHLKQQVTILLDKSAVAYQVLINLYLKDCAQMKKRLSFESGKPSKKSAA